MSRVKTKNPRNLMATSPSQLAPPPADSQTPIFRWKYGEGNVRKHGQVHGGGVVILTVLSLALFLTILYLYTRRWFQYRQSPPTTATVLDDTDVFSPDGVVTFPSGLTKKVIEGLEVKQNRVEETECSICLSKMVVGEMVKVMPGCDHGFHQECVDEWLKSHPTCPLCRRLLLCFPPSDPSEVV